MARPRKTGMDYFEHSVHMASDRKMQCIIALHGIVGYGLINFLYEQIYKEADYELDVSDAETLPIICRNFAETPVSVFEGVIASALKYGIFDVEAYRRRHVLTSHGIKERAKAVEEKREKQRTRDVSAAETQQKLPKLRAETPVSVHREEKRREENINKKPPVSSPLQEVIPIAKPKPEELVFPPAINTADCRAAWRQWLEHKKRIKKPYKSTNSQNMMLARFASYAPARFCAAVKFSIGSEYAGIFDDPDFRNGNAAGSAPSTAAPNPRFVDNVERNRLNLEKAMQKAKLEEQDDDDDENDEEEIPAFAARRK